MERSEIVKALRQLESKRSQVERLDAALEQLTADEMLLLDSMFLHPVPRAADKMCEMFDIEVSAVYKRRNKALKKLADFLGELV